ncbi:acetyl-CoA hydrolase/transferase family protein [Persicimonas caeni]|uniref:Acetyl-CoA hydrolase/transferase family protein n=1 Tax=Persicimonas caeni TaxID=2292766 RepID=A0A4Y6PYW0_PERCE|nr:acetyl-CoA hydrolase/transferase C-terminal domain-containing protein [Persicimonas caeni]QDG53511.1 acetyl-CoA hydrolase/transferase family protein [Persicimonas caeni]QED34732.1 acetyl-CoA hydrolase/transferase family protein [Persicimonas caeni]
MKTVTDLHEALVHVDSGQRVFIHGGVATPKALVEALVARAPELSDVEIIHLHTEGPAPYAEPEHEGSFRVANLFVGGNMRGRLDYDRVDYLPCFLSEIPALFRSGRRKIDVALIHVSPPDKHGYCTLGCSVDVAHAAVEVADLIIAQINPQMPRVHGDGFVHLDDIDYGIEVDVPIPEVVVGEATQVERAIGRNVASLVEDGATLQMGIGAIPNATLAELKGHKRLGVHTEMLSDGILDLLACGALDNSAKTVHPGKTVTGFLMGSRRLYDLVDDNPAVVGLDVAYVNRTRVVARNPKVTAINSAVEVDLTGQICADSIGSHVISGVGGQMDFMRGAALSEGGKPIIAMPSRTGRGVAKIVPSLKKGAGVVTTRAHVHYVVTEYGVADLYGMTLGERAKALIDIAHPEDREMLERAWFEHQKGGDL